MLFRLVQTIIDIMNDSLLDTTANSVGKAFAEDGVITDRDNVHILSS